MVTVNGSLKYILEILRALFETLGKPCTIPAMIYIMEIGLKTKAVGGL